MPIYKLRIELSEIYETDVEAPDEKTAILHGEELIDDEDALRQYHYDSDMSVTAEEKDA